MSCLRCRTIQPITTSIDRNGVFSGLESRPDLGLSLVCPGFEGVIVDLPLFIVFRAVSRAFMDDLFKIYLVFERLFVLRCSLLLRQSLPSGPLVRALRRLDGAGILWLWVAVLGILSFIRIRIAAELVFILLAGRIICSVNSSKTERSFQLLIKISLAKPPSLSCMVFSCILDSFRDILSRCLCGCCHKVEKRLFVRLLGRWLIWHWSSLHSNGLYEIILLTIEALLPFKTTLRLVIDTS